MVDLSIVLWQVDQDPGASGSVVHPSHETAGGARACLEIAQGFHKWGYHMGTPISREFCLFHGTSIFINGWFDMIWGYLYMFNFLSSSWLEMVRCYILLFSLGFSQEMIGRLRHVPLPNQEKQQSKQQLLGAFEAMFSPVETNMGLSWSEKKGINMCMFSTFFKQIYLRHQGYTIFLYAIKGIFFDSQNDDFHRWYRVP